MRKGLGITIVLTTLIMVAGCGRYVYVSGNTEIERQSPIPEITTETTVPETETAESICSSEQDTADSLIVESSTAEPVAADETEPDIYSMDVWDIGLYMYGIPYEETTRCLKLITYEGYAADSILAYYCACCCVVREIEGLWGYSDIYSAFGEIDTSYGTWMDCLGYEDWAIDALWCAYADLSYVCYCNGMTVPESYVYCNNGIYVW